MPSRTETSNPPHSFIAFQGHACLARGDLRSVQQACRAALARDVGARVLVFDHQTSEQVDVDLAPHAPASRAANAPEPSATMPERASGPGRPRLGVVAREVTLLPRHWDWLSAQPGGASVALRRLVDQARQVQKGQDRCRAAQESCYRFLSAIAGDLPGFEEAARALFAGDGKRLREHIAAWPGDLQEHALALAEPALEHGWDEGRRHA
jgi:uncharacterized protein